MKLIKTILKCLAVLLLFTSLFTFNVNAQDEVNDEETIEVIKQEELIEEDASISEDDKEVTKQDDKEDLVLIPLQQDIDNQIYDTQDISPTDGYAYAVLTDDGDFVFFRSTNTYTDQTTGSFTDIYNNPYTGTIFSGFEDLTGWSTPSWQSSTYKSNIKKAYVADNTTISPKSMNSWFYECSNLTSFDSTGFDTSNVTNMHCMFKTGVWSNEEQKYTSNLTSLDLSKFNTSNVTYMSGMFQGCSSLTSLVLSSFNTSNVIDMSWMFYDCSSLKSLDLSNFNTSNVTYMSWMFSNCSSLTSLDLSKFNTSKVEDMSGMFEGCSSLTSLDLSNFVTSNVTDMSSMFSNCRSLTELDLSNFNTSNVTYMSWMFYNCKSLESLDLSKFNTSKVTTMSNMFYVCSALEKINLSSFNTSNVTDMSGMFSQCSILTSLDLSHFVTSKVTNMNSMFSHCSKLDTLNISKFDTSNVTDMTDLFFLCESLTSLNLSKFVTSKDTTMRRMFFGCLSLKTVKLGEKFNVWKDDAYLPEGTWHNYSKDLHKTETNLYDDYPSHASAWAGTWTLLETMPLDTPVLKSIYNVKNGIDIRFNEVEAATSYIVIRIAGGKETRTEVKAEDIPEKYGYKNWTDTSVKSEYGKGFAYKVIAKNDDSESDPSDQLAIFRLNEPTITKLETKSNSVKVSWNKEKVHRYVLQYSADGTNWTTIETTATSRTITGLKSNTTYYFRVRGVMVQKDGTIHYSQYSTRKSAKTK